MGNENYSQVSDKGIQNLSKSDILTIQFKKESYYESQVVEGVIILEPKQNLVMEDILIKFKQSEYFIYKMDEKNIISDINNQTFFEKRLNAGSFLNQNSQMLSLTPGSYKFPFQFTLPRDIPPSFEFPFRHRRASLRYTFSAELLSPYLKSLSETYLWIKARPINIPSQIKHENYVKVKNVGFISRGQSGVALFTMANNFRINDMLPFTIDIYNEECDVQVKEVKISIKRIVTFVKGGKEYPKRTAILRKRYNCLCDKRSKNSFHYDDIQIRDNDLKELDFNKSLNPYPFLDDVNLLMPNIKTNLIKCEYSLKATSYFDYSVLGKDRPRVEMPIYITHQLQKEYEYERNTNQNNGQGQEFADRDFKRGFGGNFGNNNYGNNNFGNNNYGNNNFGNNNFGNNNFGNNGNNFGNNNFNNNNNNFGNNNNNNSSNNTSSSSLSSSQKFSYEAYIASKKLNNQSNNDKNKNDSWKSNSTYNNYGNNNNNFGFNNNNYGNNNNNYGNNNNNWGNNNNNNWGNNIYGGGNNNYNPGSYGGGGYNGSANPFGGGNNDFPSLDNISNNNSNQSNQFGNNNGPSNPFGNNNNNGPSNPFINNNNNVPSNPFGNNNNGPSNPFANNNNGPSNPFGNDNNGPSNPFDNGNNPPNPFGGSGGGPGPYQASYPGF